MLKKLINKFSTTLYIQLWSTRIKVTNVKTSAIFDDEPHVAIETSAKGLRIIKEVGRMAPALASGLVAGSHNGKPLNIEVTNPLSHPRTILGNFQVAEKLVQYGVKKVLGNRLFGPAPIAIIHPMEKLEGGLTDIEQRALTELALSAGAREVVIHTGSELDKASFNKTALDKAA